MQRIETKCVRVQLCVHTCLHMTVYSGVHWRTDRDDGLPDAGLGEQVSQRSAAAGGRRTGAHARLRRDAQMLAQPLVTCDTGNTQVTGGSRTGHGQVTDRSRTR